MTNLNIKLHHGLVNLHSEAACCGSDSGPEQDRQDRDS